MIICFNNNISFKFLLLITFLSVIISKTVLSFFCKYLSISSIISLLSKFLETFDEHIIFSTTILETDSPLFSLIFNVLFINLI